MIFFRLCFFDGLFSVIIIFGMFEILVVNVIVLLVNVVSGFFDGVSVIDSVFIILV